MPLLKDLAAGGSTAKNMKVIEEIEFLKTQIKRLEQLANNKDSGLELNDEINVDRKKNGSIVYYTNKLNGNNMVVTI